MDIILPSFEWKINEMFFIDPQPSDDDLNYLW